MAEPSIVVQLIGDKGGTPRNERADAQANRARILEAAEALFVQQGVAQVNMADIAVLAGVGKGTLYRHFANKAEVCLALMDDHLRTFQNQTLAQAQVALGAEQSFLTQLHIFLDGLVAFTEAHIPFLCEIQRAGLVENQAGDEPYLWQYLTVRGILEAADRAGELRPGLDIDYLADALLAPLSADVYRLQRKVRGLSPGRISDGLRSLLAGLSVLAA